jgi:hypothetical protein
MVEPKKRKPTNRKPPGKKKPPAASVDCTPDIEKQMDEEFGAVAFSAQSKELESEVEKMIGDLITFTSNATESNLIGSPGWYDIVKKQLPVKMAFASSLAMMAFTKSMRPKIEITLDEHGKIKTKKITQSSGNPAFLTIITNCIGMELEFAEKMKPPAAAAVNVPPGGDTKKHLLMDMIRKQYLAMKGAVVGNNGTGDKVTGM